MSEYYDKKDFFEAYLEMPRSKGLAFAGEWHQLEPLIPDPAGKNVPDLGCGMGWHCRYMIDHRAAGVRQEWIYDDNGKVICWPIDNYYYPGARDTDILGFSIRKYHHTLTQILNPLIALGFKLTAVEEAIPPENMMDIPGMDDEMRRPMMLLVRAEK